MRLTFIPACLCGLAILFAPSQRARAQEPGTQLESTTGPGPEPSQRDARSGAAEALQRLRDQWTRATPPWGLPPGMPLQVNNRKDLDQATLGLGYEVLALIPGIQPGTGEASEYQVKNTGLWDFLVMVADQPVGLVEVAQNDGQWRLVTAGAARLAWTVHEQVLHCAPKAEFRFLRCYSATKDFLEIRQGSEPPRLVALLPNRNPSPGFADSDSLARKPIKLPVPMLYQEHSHWCWAACAQMVLNYRDFPYSQCDIVNRAKHLTDACAGAGDFSWSNPANAGAIVQESARVIWELGVQAEALDFRVDLDQVAAQIQARRPTIVGWLVGETSEHAVVLIGLDQTTDDPLVTLNDPWPGMGPSVRTWSSTVSAPDRSWIRTCLIW